MIGCSSTGHQDMINRLKISVFRRKWAIFERNTDRRPKKVLANSTRFRTFEDSYSYLRFRFSLRVEQWGKT